MESNLFFVLLLIFFCGSIGSVVSDKLKQPTIIGYIIVGFLFGVILPRIINIPKEPVIFLSELSLSVLLFFAGLTFLLNEDKYFSRNIITGVVLQIITLITIFSLVFVNFFSFNINVALALSIIIAFSSISLTTSRGDVGGMYSTLASSWLLVMGFATVPLMLLVPLLPNNPLNVYALLTALLKSVAIIYLILLALNKLFPFIIKKLALYNNNETFLVFSFLFTVILTLIFNFMGLPIALGAFFSGVIIASCSYTPSIIKEIKPVGEIFTSIFFVSVSLLGALNFFLLNIFTVLLLVILIFLIKGLVVFILLLRLNNHSKISFYVSLLLFQVGEFGFLLATVCLNKNIISNEQYSLIITASLFSIVLNLIIFKWVPKFYKLVKIFLNKRFHFLYDIIFVVGDSDTKLPMPRKLNIVDHIVLVGYGKAGRYISKILEASKIPYVVIDINYKILKELRKKGVPSVYGDAENTEILKLAGIKKARGVVITNSSGVSNEIIIRKLRKINSALKVVIRAEKPEDVAKLTIMGIKNIIEPEFESGLRVGKMVLEFYGYKNEIIKKILLAQRANRKF